MNTVAMMFVVGTLLGLVGVILTDVYDRQTKMYRLFRGLSVLGVLSVGVGLLLYLGGGIGPSEQQDCERLGGVYIQDASDKASCIDISKLPTIQLPEAG